MRPWAAVLLLASCSLSGCSGMGSAAGGSTPPGPSAPVAPTPTASPVAPAPLAAPVPADAGPASTVPSPTPAPPVPAKPTPSVPAAAGAAAAATPVPLALESRVADVTTDQFGAVVRNVLLDPRGWEQSGFAFTFSPDAAYRVVLAEPAEVDRLCHPYGTAGRWSCQNGPVVALNADRWREATETWPGTVENYRVMLVNHEVGHLLGQHHPDEFCSSAGQPAAVMAQQSKGVQGCAANAWPLDWELACAARHEEQMAPPYEAESVPSCTG